MSPSTPAFRKFEYAQHVQHGLVNHVCSVYSMHIMELSISMNSM